MILCMDVVERSQARKYLGLRFDQCLVFIEPMNHVVMKARKGMIVMRIMTATNCEQRHKGLIPGSSFVCD
uniref:Uncharacterized protein n=1 Tax=Arion vulgaris TaxID=1028688 RepID=A0A0B6ZG66_9EUPU